MASTSKDDPPFDPYEVLGVEVGASDADISKAYRRLALKLHPDKQQNLSAAEAEKADKAFHDAKEARAFLLDPEFKEKRRKYDTKRASERLRRAEDKKRQEGMSDRRKRMREQLAAKEKREVELQRSAGGMRKKDRAEQEIIDRLKKEGSKMKEQFQERADAKAAIDRAQEAVDRKRALHDRQIRLKWSRSRMKVSPSDHSIAELLSRFGQVEQVEMIGSKGNVALVTFLDPSSCRPCVDAYKESEEMRATFVGARKEEELARDVRSMATGSGSSIKKHTDGENLADRQMRQAAERERLIREMELDEQEPSMSHKTSKGSESPAEVNTARASDYQFPPKLPTDIPGRSTFEQLGALEDSVFSKILPANVWQNMKLQ